MRIFQTLKNVEAVTGIFACLPLVSPNVNGFVNNCEIEKQGTSITALLLMNDKSYSSFTSCLTNVHLLGQAPARDTQSVFSCLLCSETAIQASFVSGCWHLEEHWPGVFQKVSQ